MKRMALVFALMYLFVSCNDQKKNTNGESPEETNTQVEPPKQIVSISEAKSMYNNYSEYRAPIIKRYEEERYPESKFDVARYVHYDYATIKQYMAYIEQEAKKANVEISSLRLYFSNYPDSSGYVHPRQNSIMLTPALKKDDREYIFYIDETEDGKSRPVLLTSSFDEEGAKGMGHVPTMEEHKSYASFLPITNSPPAYFSGKSLTMNRGGGSPPPYQ